MLEPICLEKYDFQHIHMPVRRGLLVSAQHSAFSPADLARLPLLVSNRHSLQKELAQWLGQEVARLRIVATYNLVSNVIPMVEAGYAHLLTLEGAVQSLAPQRFRFIPLQPDLTMKSVLAWKKSHSGFGALARFVSFLRKELET